MRTTQLDKIICGDINLFKQVTWNGRRRMNWAVAFTRSEKRFAKKELRRTSKLAARTLTDGAIIISRGWWL